MTKPNCSASLKIVPFRSGGRPTDELRAAGSGCSEHVDYLKVAMELAGPNIEHAQETWHRVFRDAEQAVLSCSDDAFPELAQLPRMLREVVRWRRCGELVGGMRLPAPLTAAFGDQDGLYGSACHHYRASMNDVAKWARERRLIDFTGDECIPRTVSLIEARA